MRSTGSGCEGAFSTTTTTAALFARDESFGVSSSSLAGFAAVSGLVAVVAGFGFATRAPRRHSGYIPVNNCEHHVFS